MHQFHHNLLLAEMRKFDRDSTVLNVVEYDRTGPVKANTFMKTGPQLPEN